MEARRPHLVALAVSGEGHVSPMMHLCDHLAKHSLSITFALLEDNKPLDMVLSRGTWPPPGSNITLAEIKSSKIVSFPENAFTEDKIDFVVMAEYRTTNFSGPLKVFLEELGSVDCLVFDYHLSWAIHVAKELGIPTAVLFTGNMAWNWCELNMTRLVSSGAVPMTVGEEKFEDYKILEELPTLRRSDIPWHFWNDRPWQEYTSNKSSKVFAKARWIFVMSCEELEPELTRTMKQLLGNDKYLPVGPLFVLNDHPENVGFASFDPHCMQWLDEQPASSVLYISFGSYAKLSIEQLVELGEGLISSKCKFLWVARKCADKKLMDFYESFGSRSKQQGFFTPWAPQTLVLSHPSVGAFLSHCGWNSTLEGIANGQVILCWPCLFDQNLNRKLVVEDWKVGFAFDKSQGKVVNRKEVEGKIRLAMEEEQGREARQRVQELSCKVRGAVTATGSSQKNLQQFIQEIKTL